jgi:hypothetical protein
LSLEVKRVDKKSEKKTCGVIAASERLSLSNRCKARNVFHEGFN